MSIRRDGTIAGQNRTLFRVGVAGAASDGQLLERYATSDGEPAELAFAALVERHGPMVSRVCRAVLRDEHDAQDASQATFVILASKARSHWVRDSIGPWLHAVAYRVSCRARTAASRRRRHERAAVELTSRRPALDESRDELQAALHGEIARLPERYRAPMVLCDLEGHSLEQAARDLGCPVGTIKSRLSRGRERLRRRVERRGLAPPSGLSASAIPAALAARSLATDPCASADVRRLLDARSAGARVPEAVQRLSEEVLRMFFLARLKAAGAVVVASSALVFGSVALTAPQEPAPPPMTEEEQKERQAKASEQFRLEEAEKRRLVGTWARVSRSIDGRPPNIPEARRAGTTQSRTFRDDRKAVVSWRDEFAENPERRGGTITMTYSFNPSKSPKELTIFGNQGLFQMIYELEGDTLRLAYYGRSEVDRPRGFSRPDGGPIFYPIVVETLKRVDVPIEP